jgi:hypothetical protein
MPIAGVSTRRVDKLVRQLGVEGVGAEGGSDECEEERQRAAERGDPVAGAEEDHGRRAAIAGDAQGVSPMPSLRSSMIAARRQRIVSGENGSVKGSPFCLWSGLSSRGTR